MLTRIIDNRSIEGDKFQDPILVNPISIPRQFSNIIACKRFFYILYSKPNGPELSNSVFLRKCQVIIADTIKSKSIDHRTVNSVVVADPDAVYKCFDLKITEVEKVTYDHIYISINEEGNSVGVTDIFVNTNLWLELAHLDLETNTITRKNRFNFGQESERVDIRVLLVRNRLFVIAPFPKIVKNFWSVIVFNTDSPGSY